MRVLIDGRVIQDHFPGIGRYTLNLTRALAEFCRDDQLILLCDPSSPDLSPSFSSLSRDIRPQLIHTNAEVFSFASQWQIPRRIKTLRPSLFHAPYYVRPYYVPVPVVFSAYDLIPIKCPQFFSALQRLIYRLAMSLSLRTARRTICLSHTTARDLEEVFKAPADRLCVIPAAADPAFTRRTRNEIEWVRRKYGLPERYVLYFGSNKPHKNLVRLIEAWKRADRQGGRLVIAGHWDPGFPKPRQRVGELDLESTVCFIGAVSEPDVAALYSGAELFVFPSLYEGFGFPVLEAMACGVPVICSQTSSLREVAQGAAVLIDPLGVEEIATAIEKVLCDEALREELIQRGLSNDSRYSWSETARQTRDVYARAIQP